MPRIVVTSSAGHVLLDERVGAGMIEDERLSVPFLHRLAVAISGQQPSGAPRLSPRRIAASVETRLRGL